MTWPTLSVDLAVSTRPTETPTWTDISAKVLELRMRRGKQHMLDRTEAGSMDVLLDNSDRRFDPTYQGTELNFINDPSFEQGDSGGDGVSDGWTKSASAGLLVAYSLSSAQTRRGTGQSQKVEAAYLSATLGRVYLYSNTKTVAEGEVWTGSAYIYVESRTGNPYAQITLAFRDSGSSVLSETYTVWDGTLDAWKRLSATATAPAGTATVEIWCQIMGCDASGENIIVYFDDCQLQPNDLSDYTDGSLDNCRWSGTAHASSSYRGGPYYGDLKPMRRIRVQTEYDGETYDLWSGFVLGWPQVWDNGVVPVVRLRAMDAFHIFSLKKLNKAYTEKLAGARIDEVLDDIGWTAGNSWILDSSVNSLLGTTTILAPNGDRYVMEGQSTIMAETLADASALSHLQDVAQTELGWIFMDGAGVFTFLDRRYRFHPDFTTSLATFGDAAGELNYSSLQLDYDETDIYNEIRMGREDGTVQTAEDATSQLDYFERTMAQEALKATTDLEMADRANWLLSRHKDPHWKAKQITFGGGDTSLWQHLFGREIGDRITVTRRPQGGDAITDQYHIEGVEHEVVMGQSWHTRWALTLTDPTKYWHISNGSDDFAAYAVLGTTTVLCY